VEPFVVFWQHFFRQRILNLQYNKLRRQVLRLFAKLLQAAEVLRSFAFTISL